MISYLEILFKFIDKLLSYEIINGVSLYIMFFYSMILVSFWAVFTRR